MIIHLPMATAQKPLVHSNDEEEVQSFFDSPGKRKRARRRQSSLSGSPERQWRMCVICLLSCIALCLAVIAVQLWLHNYHHTKIEVDTTSPKRQQVTLVAGPDGDGEVKTPKSYYPVPADTAPKVSNKATTQNENNTMINQEIKDSGVNQLEAPKASPAPQPQADHPAYEAWLQNAWLPAPFTVRTENLPGSGVMNKYTNNWGTWQLGELPAMDRTTFCGEESHCDVPRNKFPADAWQTDKEFVAKFLDEADRLVDRARNAILAEYGKSPKDTAMFDLKYRDDDLKQARNLKNIFRSENGGWTTKRSMEGLSRRILHAIMTRDTFTFVLGGHSAAAGHGNHFKQSYAMQFHKVMEPVFSYLGVQLISRNLAQGGLGTIQSALGSADIYGDEIDFFVWDSGMTEGRDGKAVDMFGRQALMGNRVPVLWNLNLELLEMYHEFCGADIGQFGTASLGIPISENQAQAETLPYAAQYVECDKELHDMCKEHKFHANCWVDRPDVIPPKKQSDKPGSQVSWHPGFRKHQLTGRVLAYTVLTGLKQAIAQWRDAEDYVLPDETWHVTSYYDNIRTKVASLDHSLGDCVKNYNGTLPTRMCSTKMRGRTEFTPRANPESTSIRSILRKGGYVPSVEQEILYNGPDVRNPMFDIPKGHVDVLAILNNGRTFPGNDDGSRRRLSIDQDTRRISRRTVSSNDAIVPGKGIQLDHPVGYCDGTFNAVCNRDADNDCLLSGHHDARGGLRFNEYSGWIVMDIPKVKEGLIMIKLETWHQPDKVQVTEGWTSVNNERRNLKSKPPEYCEDFHFDFAVDGNITTHDLEQFKEASKQIQRVVEVLTMLDDPEYVKDGEEKDVELAIRMRGCGRDKVFSLTHVYWA